MSSSNSPCAACKCLRRKCTQECVFAPYFPPDNPQKFTNVHKVFGASNVAKLLNELAAGQREDAVNSLAYEAEYRLRDPVYGCVGLISVLQHQLKQVQIDLDNAKKELASYIGPQAMLPILNHPGLMQHQGNFGPSGYQVMPYNNMQSMMGLPTGVPQQLMMREPQQQQQQQQQMLEAQQLAVVAAAREQEMLRNYEQQHQQQQNELVGFNGGFNESVGPVTATGFNQIPEAGEMQPSLALGGSYETNPYQHIQQQQQEHTHSHSQSYHHHHPHQLQIRSQPHDLLHHQQQQQQQKHATTQQQSVEQLVQPQQQPQRAKSEEGRSNMGPSC